MGGSYSEEHERFQAKGTAYEPEDLTLDELSAKMDEYIKMQPFWLRVKAVRHSEYGMKAYRRWFEEHADETVRRMYAAFQRKFRAHYDGRK